MESAVRCRRAGALSNNIKHGKDDMIIQVDPLRAYENSKYKAIQLYEPSVMYVLDLFSFLNRSNYYNLQSYHNHNHDNHSERIKKTRKSNLLSLDALALKLIQISLLWATQPQPFPFKG
jgi:hypothetical protein